MKRKLFGLLMMVLAFVMATISLTACSDDEDISSTTGVITISSDYTDVKLGCNETWYEIPFNARAVWKATLTAGGNWCELKDNSGTGGDKQSFGIVMTKNETKTPREAIISLTCLGDEMEIRITQAASDVDIMDPSTIENYDKYYLPSANNEYFEGGADAMLRSDSQYSWFRMRQSEHFFVFWAPGFGDDPNSESVDEAMRVDVDDLLEKAEQFYATNIEKLKMVTTGEGKSYLDKYKMEIYLLYQTEWLATGSGYDNTIGALWVNPGTCKPVGSTIAHEIGHSFQYQVSCDKVLNGEADFTKVGFRYGFGPNGEGGCPYWEQCAQWQSFQDYPAETFGYHIDVWKKNHHRHFNHEWMRYACYWLQYYWTQKRGIEAYGRIWKESAYPEDPIEAYTRLYCGGDIEKFYDEYYDYAARCVTYDFDAVHQYATEDAQNYNVTMFKTDGAFRPAYSDCPGTTGFNIIPLDVPAAGTKVCADLEAMAPGSALSPKDGGQMVDGDGKPVGTTTTYNSQSNTTSAYRIGFVSVRNGKAAYGTMAKGKNTKAEYTVPAGTDKLYLVVVATPTTYNRQYWNDIEADDEQWPYSVRFGNTSLKGYIEIDPSKSPEDVTLKHSVKCDAALNDYVQGTIDLAANGDLAKICKAFVLESAELASATQTIASGVTGAPAEGKVTLGLLQPDGTIGYTYSANTGFYCTADGNVGAWNDTDPVYFEYDKSDFKLSYGHKPGNAKAGTTYKIKPVLVYIKGGRQYKAVIELDMSF